MYLGYAKILLQHLNNLLKEMCTDSLLVQEYIDGIECEVLVLQYKGKYYALDPVQILFKTNLNFIDTDTSNTYNYEFKVIESSIKFLLQATAQKRPSYLE